MIKLLKRGEELARAEQKRKLEEIAGELKKLVRGASVEVDEARVLVTGRGLVKRWLIDPRLRFLSNGPK